MILIISKVNAFKRNSYTSQRRSSLKIDDSGSCDVDMTQTNDSIDSEQLHEVNGRAVKEEGNSKEHTRKSGDVDMSRTIFETFENEKPSKEIVILGQEKVAYI